MEKTLKELKKIATKYMNKANEKWLSMQDDFYVCYEYSELMSKVIYDLFEKDAFNDVGTWYKRCDKYGNYGFHVLCELEEHVYFSFIIYNVTGAFGDNGEHVTEGKFKIMKELPKGYNDIWDLFDSENEESEEV